MSDKATALMFEIEQLEDALDTRADNGEIVSPNDPMIKQLVRAQNALQSLNNSHSRRGAYEYA